MVDVSGNEIGPIPLSAPARNLADRTHEAKSPVNLNISFIYTANRLS